MNKLNEYWLSVDLSSPKGTLAIHKATPHGDLELIASKTLTETGDHSESFIPKLELTLKENRLSLSQIHRFITSSGPGSFTGLRVAFASLKALAYGRKSPIDVLSGSEARALRWLKNQNPMTHDEIQVLTYITADRFVAAQFKIDANNSYSFIEDKSYSDGSFLASGRSIAVLLDDRVARTSVPANPSILIASQPLHAEMLGEALLKASTRKTYQSVSDWIQLTPNYFGSTRF